MPSPDRPAWEKKREHRTLTGRPWRRLRDAVLLRDGYRCQGCKRLCLAEELECDHIIPLAKGGKDTMENLQALCAGETGCHAAKSRREAAQAAGHRVKEEIGSDGWPVA